MCTKAFVINTKKIVVRKNSILNIKKKKFKDPNVKLI